MTERTEKGSILKGNNFLSQGVHLFLLEKTSFQKGLGVHKHKQKAESKSAYH